MRPSESLVDSKVPCRFSVSAQGKSHAAGPVCGSPRGLQSGYSGRRTWPSSRVPLRRDGGEQGSPICIRSSKQSNSPRGRRVAPLGNNKRVERLPRRLCPRIVNGSRRARGEESPSSYIGYVEEGKKIGGRVSPRRTPETGEQKRATRNSRAGLAVGQMH